MINVFKFFRCACFYLLMPFSALAQTSERFLLEEIRSAYNQLNYAEAEIKAQAALKEYRRFTLTQLTEIHQILALIYFSQNKVEDAREHFEDALSLTPSLEMDPVLVSPKIVDFFEEIKQSQATKQREQNDTGPQVKYILVDDPRPAAALRSMLVPGWGQLYKGEKTKGWLLVGLWTAGVIGSAATHIAREQAEDSYLAETDPAKIESRFDTFNTFHKVRNNLLIFSGGVWLYSYLDAFLRKKSSNLAADSKHAIFVSSSFSTRHAVLVVWLNF